MVWKAAEFFAGIGLVRMALEQAGVQVVWANDIEPIKARLYEANFDASDFHLGDVRDVVGDDLPAVDLATASFPCTDLSLAGTRSGLAGKHSGVFWEFARILDEMGEQRPGVVLLENVPGFVTSHGGEDLAAAVGALNRLGYTVDIVQLDAKLFVPQSRPRLFVIGSGWLQGIRPTTADLLRPQRVIDFVSTHLDLDVCATISVAPEAARTAFSGLVERFPADASVWWDAERIRAFSGSLSLVQAARLEGLRSGRRRSWRTAYRRTRNGVPRWEIRADETAGCLRTARGGSSRQAVVEAGCGEVRVRWMTPREYARLQGAPDTFNFGDASANQVMFGFGDAVCVPAVAWIVKQIIVPLLEVRSGRDPNRHDGTR